MVILSLNRESDHNVYSIHQDLTTFLMCAMFSQLCSCRLGLQCSGIWTGKWYRRFGEAGRQRTFRSLP